MGIGGRSAGDEEQSVRNIMAIEWVQWVAGVGAFLLLIAFVAAAWWAWYGDRSKGRRRCPKCWHDLSHTPGAICGECGYHGPEERVFYKSRRRPALALLAILACALLCSFVIDRANVRGWAGFIPTSVLLWSVPYADDRNGMVILELERRMSSQEFGDSAWLKLAERIAKGDAGARPATEAWELKYGRILARWDNRMLTSGDDEQQEAIHRMLMDIPAGVRATSRLVWPEGVPPTVDVRILDWWWPEDTQMRVTATPDVPGAKPDVHVRYRRPIQRRSYSIYLPELEPGDHEVEIEFVCQRRMASNESWAELVERTITVPLHIEPAQDEPVMKGVSSEAMDAAIRRCFSTGLSRHTTGSLPVRVGLDVRQTYMDLFNNVGIGVRIDVLRNGVLARQLDIWWVGGAGAIPRQHAWEVPMWDDAVLLAPDSEDDQWSLRVRSMPKLALRLEDVEQYWEGEVTVDVNTFTPRGGRTAAPSRGWMLELHAESPEAAAGAAEPAPAGAE
jgi:hypothetical protein